MNFYILILIAFILLGFLFYGVSLIENKMKVKELYFDNNKNLIALAGLSILATLLKLDKMQGIFKMPCI